ncbi:MAG: hypothetical protein OEM52_10470 [bacterium]|nr:hypothetical protein [bacterium]
MQMINGTVNWLKAKRSVSTMLFGRTVTNYSVLLFGPGQIAAVGVPIPTNGRLKRMMVYDGSNLFTVEDNINVKAGDLLSIAANYANPYFTIVAQLGSSPTALSVGQISGNRDILASILIELTDDEWNQ